MKEQFDIAPARKRAGVTQREVEVDLGLPAVSLSAIEDGRIGIDAETHEQIHEAIKRVASKKEAMECQERPTASAVT